MALAMHLLWCCSSIASCRCSSATRASCVVPAPIEACSMPNNSSSSAEATANAAKIWRRLSGAESSTKLLLFHKPIRERPRPTRTLQLLSPHSTRHALNTVTQSYPSRRASKRACSPASPQIQTFTHTSCAALSCALHCRLHTPLRPLVNSPHAFSQKGTSCPLL